MPAAEMTSRERFLAAIRNQVPDRVPVAPDISTYIPTRRTGLPFWEVLMEGRVPLWQAYLEAAEYYGLDAWTAPEFGLPMLYEDTQAEWHNQSLLDTARDAMIQSSTVKTPAGTLSQQVICFRGDPPAASVKLIKNLSQDFAAFKYTRPLPKALDHASLDTLRQACHSRNYAFGVTITYPGFQNWNSYIEGGVQALTYAEYDTPEFLQEWCEWDVERGNREMDLALRAGLDYILFGGSGTITLASPVLAAKYAIPALASWSRLAQQADLPTMLHSCGKDRVLADMLVRDTCIGMLNPLEVPPMGDIDLAEIKAAHGHHLALMGNLHTTDVMLLGTPREVECAAIEAMRAAGPGGGFILSTGDQCGRETPDANLFAMVDAARRYGRYDRTTGTLPDLPATDHIPFA